MCGANYKSDDIKFLGQVDNHCFMQLHCHACSVPVLATVFLSDKPEEVGIDSAKIPKAPLSGRARSRASDLKPREKARFVAKGSIASAEIADFHLFLSSYQGNFNRLSKTK